MSAPPILNELAYALIEISAAGRFMAGGEGVDRAAGKILHAFIFAKVAWNARKKFVGPPGFEPGTKGL